MLSGILTFMRESTRAPDVPKWATPNYVVLDTDAFRLRCFAGVGSVKESSPILVVTPQAGHHSAICDFSESNSLVRVLLTRTKNPVYAMEWKPATPERRNETISDTISQIHQAVMRTAGGQPVHLIGLCQGGWASAIYASLYAHNVKSLTLAGSPIDTHAGDSKIQFFLKCLVYPMPIFRTVVSMFGGVWPGFLQLYGFKVMNPVDRFWLDYRHLLEKVESVPYVERYRRFRNWYEYTQDLPGAWLLESVERLFIRNELHRNEFSLHGFRADLRSIPCPVNLIGGNSDDITPPEQVLLPRAFRSSRKVRTYLVNSGHIGLFMSSLALTGVWREICGSIAESDRRGGIHHLNITPARIQIGPLQAATGLGTCGGCDSHEGKHAGISFRLPTS